MKLWMSGEIQADVADAYRLARRALEALINERLQAVSLKTDAEKWAFIAIIRPDDHPDYPEIKRKDRRRKVLEFRLKIDHSKYLNADSSRRKDLIIDALKRTVELMAGMGVDESDRERLIAILDQLRSRTIEN